MDAENFKQNKRGRKMMIKQSKKSCFLFSLALSLVLLANCTTTQKTYRQIEGRTVVDGCSEADKWLFNVQFTQDLEKCTQGIPSAASANHCLRDIYRSISDTCVSCFGEVVTCSSQNCMRACFPDRKSEKCRSCVKDNCADRLSQCTGIDKEELKL